MPASFEDITKGFYDSHSRNESCQPLVYAKIAEFGFFDNRAVSAASSSNDESATLLAQREVSTEAGVFMNVLVNRMKRNKETGRTAMFIEDYYLQPESGAIMSYAGVLAVQTAGLFTDLRDLEISQYRDSLPLVSGTAIDGYHVSTGIDYRTSIILSVKPTTQNTEPAYRALQGALSSFSVVDFSKVTGDIVWNSIHDDKSFIALDSGENS